MKCNYFITCTKTALIKSIFSAQNAPKIIWQPDCDWTHWESLSASPDSLAMAGEKVGIKKRRERKGKRKKGREGKKVRERREGKAAQCLQKLAPIVTVLNFRVLP